MTFLLKQNIFKYTHFFLQRQFFFLRKIFFVQSDVRWLGNYISFCYFLAFVDVIFALPQAARAISGAKRRTVSGKLHIILLLSCVCECNFTFATSRESDSWRKAALSIWQFTYHFAIFLRLRM